jgi:hypothetical protein
MRKAINKLCAYSEVLNILDAAGELDHAEDRSLDTSLAVFGSEFRRYLQELPPSLRPEISAIGDLLDRTQIPLMKLILTARLKPI